MWKSDTFTKNELKIYNIYLSVFIFLPKIFHSGGTALLQYLNSNTKPARNHRYEIIDKTLDEEIKCDKSY